MTIFLCWVAVLIVGFILGCIIWPYAWVTEAGGAVWCVIIILAFIVGTGLVNVPRYSIKDIAVEDMVAAVPFEQQTILIDGHPVRVIVDTTPAPIKHVYHLFDYMPEPDATIWRIEAKGYRVWLWWYTSRYYWSIENLLEKKDDGRTKETN